MKVNQSYTSSSFLNILQLVGVHLPTKMLYDGAVAKVGKDKRERFCHWFDISPKKNKFKFFRLGLHKNVLKPRNISGGFSTQKIFKCCSFTPDAQIVWSSA